MEHFEENEIVNINYGKEVMILLKITYLLNKPLTENTRGIFQALGGPEIM